MSRDVVLYTRRECGLCDETAAELHRLSGELRFQLRKIDIDTDAELRSEYNDIVPAVAIGDRVIAHAPTDVSELRTLVEAALKS